MWSKKSYIDIVIHTNNKRHNVRTSSIHNQLIKNYDVRTNVLSSNDKIHRIIVSHPTCEVSLQHKYRRRHGHPIRYILNVQKY